MISLFCTFFSVFDIPVVSGQGGRRAKRAAGAECERACSLITVLARLGHLLALADGIDNEETDPVRTTVFVGCRCLPIG